jgi:hypothetical protein
MDPDPDPGSPKTCGSRDQDPDPEHCMKVLALQLHCIAVKPVCFRNLVRGFGTWFTVVGVYGLARATYRKHYREALPYSLFTLWLFCTYQLLIKNSYF